MKKLNIYFGLIAALFTLTSHAQFEHDQFGIKAGGQITNFSGDDAEAVKLDSKVGILAGIYGTFRANNLALQPEFLISHKGPNFQATNNNLRLWYIDIPFTVKYYLHEKFNIHAGPQVGALVYAEFDGEKVDDEFKNIDFGLVGGIEYEAPQNFTIGLRYNYGISEISEESTALDATGVSVTKEATDYRNTAIQLYLALDLTKLKKNKKGRN